MAAGRTLWTVVGLLLASGPAACTAQGAAGHAVASDRVAASAAPAAPAGQAAVDTGQDPRFREGRHVDEHGERRYRLYVPDGAGPGSPLVVLLHGCTQTPADFAVGSRANRWADSLGALILYPAQPAEAHPQRCWSWYDPAHQARGAGEPAILAGMVRHVLNDTGADPDRVHVGGMSAGGAMAQVLAAAYPELFRALAVHSAPAYGSATGMAGALAVLQEGAADPDALPDRLRTAMGDRARPVPVLVIHGSDDPVVRVVNGRQVVRQWAGLAVEVGSGVEIEVESGAERVGEAGECPEVMGLDVEVGRLEAEKPGRRCVYSGAPVRLEYVEVQELGHAWSGGSEDGSYTDPGGPDATALILEFFLSGEPRP